MTWSRPVVLLLLPLLATKTESAVKCFIMMHMRSFRSWLRLARARLLSESHALMFSELEGGDPPDDQEWRRFQ